MTVPILDAAGEVRPLAAIEAEVIAAVLVICKGNMSDTARRLGIARNTLYRKIHQEKQP